MILIDFDSFFTSKEVDLICSHCSIYHLGKGKGHMFVLWSPWASKSKSSFRACWSTWLIYSVWMVVTILCLDIETGLLILIMIRDLHSNSFGHCKSLSERIWYSEIFSVILHQYIDGGSFIFYTYGEKYHSWSMLLDSLVSFRWAVHGKGQPDGGVPVICLVFE